MIIRLSVMLATFLACSIAYAGNFTLTIDGKDYEFDKGEKQSIKLSDGKIIQVMLNEKSIVTYKTNRFSFDHNNQYVPSRTAVEAGLYQTTMMTPSGTLIMLQDYSMSLPSSVIDIMIKALTEDEIQTGYKMKQSDAERVLSDGTKLAGKKVITTKGSDEMTRYILTANGDNSGVIIVFQIDKEYYAKENKIFSLFLKTLKLTLD